MKAWALALVTILLLAGCAAPSATQVQPKPGGSAHAPLTEDLYSFGQKLALQFPSFDGTPIHVDVQLPNGSGPFPTLIQYTPYSNTLSPTDELWADGVGTDALVNEYVPRGFAVGIAHVRGSGQSGGCFTTGGPDEARDGYSLVEFIANQTWSSKRVALMGTSYVGTTPISTATLHPPHLTTIVPVSAVSEWYRYYYENGEPRFFGELPFGVVYTDQPIWAATGFFPKPRDPTAYDPNNAQCGIAQIQNAWQQDDYNAYWMDRNYVKDIGNATAPMLYAHGFLDENTPTSLVTDFYAKYPGEKRLWMQQHDHGVPGSFKAYYEYVHRWLDHFMLDKDNGALELPPVILEDNRGKYHAEADWPPQNTTLTLFHLTEGSLSSTPPQDSTVSYQAESKNLTFVSDPLAADLHLSGAPRVELVASSDKADTQWDTQLWRIAADGSEHFVTRGYLDARHAHDLTRGHDITPGEEDLYSFAMHARDYHFAKGEKIKLVVASVDTYVMPDAPGATNTLRLGAQGSRIALPTLANATYLDEAPTIK